jgi:hypothetical protein
MSWRCAKMRLPMTRAIMQKVLDLLLKRKISTQRVDDMPNAQARAALDQRMNRMLALHSNVPLPQRAFAPLSNPIQNRQDS